MVGSLVIIFTPLAILAAISVASVAWGLYVRAGLVRSSFNPIDLFRSDGGAVSQHSAITASFEENVIQSNFA